jgi:tRNA A37 methylthiotransferase MiaB
MFRAGILIFKYELYKVLAFPFFCHSRCTVKNPSQSAMTTLISKCKNANKPLVVAGCVPQGSQGLKELEGISIIGVQQIDRVVEVVEETLKGHEVRLLSRKTLPSLDLPKVHIICGLIYILYL